MKNSDQVILAHELNKDAGTGVISLDVSGAEPAIQWEATLLHDPSLQVEAWLLLVGEDLFIGEHRLDPATGADSPAPWARRNRDGQDNPDQAVTIPLSSHDGVVIACSQRICSGWVKEDGEWTMRWERDSTPPGRLPGLPRMRRGNMGGPQQLEHHSMGARGRDLPAMEMALHPSRRNGDHHQHADGGGPRPARQH